MEGQNFLENNKPYGLFSGNVGLSWQMAYLRKRWAFKGEMKAVYTFTDYLDDYGPGVWFGGDYERWLSYLKNSEQFASPDAGYFTEIGEPRAKFLKTTGGNQLPNMVSYSAVRSTNGLNDWYFQMHLGLSYFLNSTESEKEFKSLKEIQSESVSSEIE